MWQATKARKSIRLVALLMAGGAHAQMTLPSDPTLAAQNAELRLRPSYQACIDASMAITPALLECSDREFTYQDGRLNDAYKKLRASLTTEQRSKLRDEQRTWLADKKARCSAGNETGQGELVVSATCEITETAKRANELADRR